jgi:hypothetical protein
VQGGSAYVNIDGGAQPQRRTIAATSTFTVYDEEASVSATQRIRNGAVFEISGGARVTPTVAVGVGFSTFGRSGTGEVTGSIPNPAFFNRYATQVKDASDLKHREQAINLRVSWFRLLSDDVEVALSAGPSFVRVTQGLATNITVPTGTQDFTVSTVEAKGTAVGGNAGIDATYMLSPGLGLGMFVHYTFGTVDLPSVPDVKVGGLQTGLGAHLRF